MRKTKSKIRNPKQYRIFKIRNSKLVLNFDIKALNLFRNSILGFSTAIIFSSVALASSQAGVDIAVLNAGVGLAMLPAKDNQITGNKDQNPGGNRQGSVCFHFSFPPLNNKVNNKQKDAAYYSGKEICIGNIPLNHDFTPSINFNEKKTNINVMASEGARVNKNPKMFMGRINKGEITPTANHATEALPKISDNLSNWSTDNFITGRIVTC